MAHFWVLSVAPGDHIVDRSIRHPFRGHPVDPTDATALRRVEEELVEGGAYLDFSWALMLRPLDGERTRLPIRTRADDRPTLLRLAEVPLGLVDVSHVSTMFAGDQGKGRGPATGRLSEHRVKTRGWPRHPARNVWLRWGCWRWRWSCGGCQ